MTCLYHGAVRENLTAESGCELHKMMILILCVLWTTGAGADEVHPSLEKYNVVWDSPSVDSAGSMPLGNGDIGANVWVEKNGDLLFYISKTDAWTEDVQSPVGLVKVGRVRVKLTPNPYADAKEFRQTLELEKGRIVVSAG